MKYVSGLAIAAAVALSLSTSSAFAFNTNGGFGGSAKYLAGNLSGSAGHVYGNGGGCACEGNSDGELKLSNSSEQYNNTYSSRRYGYSKFGGESGAINQIDAKWKGMNTINLDSKSASFGISGFAKN